MCLFRACHLLIYLAPPLYIPTNKTLKKFVVVSCAEASSGALRSRLQQNTIHSVVDSDGFWLGRHPSFARWSQYPTVGLTPIWVFGGVTLGGTRAEKLLSMDAVRKHLPIVTRASHHRSPRSRHQLIIAASKPILRSKPQARLPTRCVGRAMPLQVVHSEFQRVKFTLFRYWQVHRQLRKDELS